jgi:hypothetical protein
VRHALRPYSTVVIAEDGMRAFPFDVNHVLVRTYHHLSEDIGFGEAMRFRQEPTKAIAELMPKDPDDATHGGPYQDEVLDPQFADKPRQITDLIGIDG